MNATQWMEDWKEGVTALDSAEVRFERLRHQTAYMEQELNKMDNNDKSVWTKIKEVFTR